MGAPIVHFEIGCRDREKTGAFYAALFDWTLSEPQANSVMIDTGAGEGVNGHLTALGHEPHNYVNIYAQVDDLEATVARASELGGSIVVPPTEVPGMGSFAWLADPEGTVIGLWKPIASA